jgi:hypothetical protein
MGIIKYPACYAGKYCMRERADGAAGSPKQAGHDGSRAPFLDNPPLYYPFTANGPAFKPDKYVPAGRIAL